LSGEVSTLKPGGHDALEDARGVVAVFMGSVIGNNLGQTTFFSPIDVDEFSPALGG
jgi:hypothetical protein